MELTKKISGSDQTQENNHLLRMLDRGIDDMEAGRELPLEDAFRKITELRNARTNAEFKSIQYCFPRTHFLYRGYSIHKKSFPPSIIFYIIEQT